MTESALLVEFADPAVTVAVGEIVAAATSRLPEAGLGFYLHGSAVAGEVRPGGDVDVLALSERDVAPCVRDELTRIAREAGGKHGVLVDFHLHSLDALIADPYVDLTRAGRLLWGQDYRTVFPAPTLDALARESIQITLLYATGIRGTDRISLPLGHPAPADDAFGRLGAGGAHGLAKMLLRFAACVMSVQHGYSPTDSADALREVGTRELAHAGWLDVAVSTCRGSDSVDSELRRVCEEMIAFEVDVIATILSKGATLGPRCAELVESYGPQA